MKNAGTKLLLLLALLVCAPAAAQDFAAAGRHFAAAQDAFSQGRFVEAAREFQATYDITRDPVLLFNVGESRERAGDAAGALKSYQAYLAAQPAATDRAEVEKRVARLKAQQAAGPAQVPKEAEQAQGEGGSIPSEKKPPEPERASVLRTAAWSTVAVTVALLTAGAVLGLSAQNRADELHRRATLLEAGQVPPVYDQSQREVYTSLLSDGHTYNDAAIACFTLAGVGAAASAVLFLLDRRHRPARTSVRMVPGRAAALAWSF